MKRPFQDAPTIWHAIVVIGVVILLAFLFSLCGCRTNQRTEDRGQKTDIPHPLPSSVLRPPSSILPPLAPPPMPPMIKVDREKVRQKVKLAHSIQEGNGGSEVISNQLSVIRTFDAACSNDFSPCRIEYHRCETNQFELWETFEDGSTLGRWYSGTNVLRWNAEAGHIYIPEFTTLAPIGGEGQGEGAWQWISDAYLSTNAPGPIEYRALHYLDEGPMKFFRIRRTEAQVFSD